MQMPAPTEDHRRSQRAAPGTDPLALRITTAGAEGRYTYRFRGDDRYDLKIESSFDGGTTLVKFMEGTYRRSAGAPER